ncbi:UDP-N-acetylglucosamine 2-epimerase [Bacillus freudenreichii]|nr:UDP-N-acetylglucosamine 2-epimerase [Bacillus freudenreichii]
MVPLIFELKTFSKHIDSIVTVTDVTTRALEGLDAVMQQEINPNLVHSDISTYLAASLTVFYNQISVGYVVAELRTGNKDSPFP